MCLTVSRFCLEFSIMMPSVSALVIQRRMSGKAIEMQLGIHTCPDVPGMCGACNACTCVVCVPRASYAARCCTG